MSNVNSELLKSIHQILVRPGTIWWLPVSYGLDYLPEVLTRVSDTECTLSRDPRLWHTNNLKYKSDLVADVVVKTKVRPFLVIGDFDVLRTMKKFCLPKWYANAVAGFPITSIENLKNRRDIGINVDRISDHNFLHFLPKSQDNGLFVDSYIAISVLISIDLEFFTQKIGTLEETNFIAIKEKIRTRYGS